MRRIAILDAPSNLGLRPPTATSVPGCAKAPGALRDHSLLTRLHARDAGCLTPPRYDPGDWRPGDGVAQAAEIAAYSRKLADRIGAVIDAGEFPVVLGGDCSIVLGSGLAMNRLGEDIGGRIGLVFVDGHSDFRHPGNASYVGAAAGEGLALVTGRGQPDLAAMEGRRPYFRDIDVVMLGIRAQDEYRLDLQAAGIITRPVPALRAEGAARTAQWARDQLVDCAGYWVHLDMDVLDPAVMPAVDAPSPGGIAFPELEILLAGLVDTPHCLGVEITVYDPDYDLDGSYAEEITAALVSGLAPVRTAATRPDLIAARRDLATRADERHTPAATFAPAATFPRAAAAMSGGGSPSGTPEEAAGPAVTMPGVADGDEVEGREPAWTGESGDDTYDQAADDEVAVDDTVAGGVTGDEPVNHWPVADDDPQPLDGHPAESEPHGAVSEHDDAVSGHDDGVSEHDDRGFQHDDGFAHGGGGSVHDQQQVPGGPLVPRPLGSSPMLDSEPLPATRPGMLRPRPSEDNSFTLPVQRPAFDISGEKPADIS